MASTGERWRLGRRPALDGVRGIAVLLVLADHTWVPDWRAAGPVGVTVFFTLSGFLITSLMLEEQGRDGRISIRSFYLRRARRLLPALLASAAAVALASVFIGPWFFDWSDLLAVVAYVGNWVQVNGSLGGLAGTWSLAVEEQFYLVWPVVMILCLRRGRGTVAVVATIGAVASFAARTWQWTDSGDQLRVYYGSDMHVDALLVGALLAVAMHRSKVRKPWPLLGTVTIALAVACGRMAGDAVWIVVPAVVPALTAVAIYAFVRGHDQSGWLSTRPLAWFGQRSYGLYLWHCPVSVYLTIARPDLAWQLRAFILLAVSLPLAELSWRYVELPLLRRPLKAKAGRWNLGIPRTPSGHVGHVRAVPQVDV